MNDMLNFKDRVKLSVSPSIDVDCSYLANLVDPKNTTLVIVPEHYLRLIEKNSHIFEILQGDSIDDRLLEVLIESATKEYELELEG
jgi:hypothetical protein